MSGTSGKHLFSITCFFLASAVLLFGARGVSGNGDAPASGRCTTEAAMAEIAAGDDVVCVETYERFVKDPAYGKSTRTVKEIRGIVKETGPDGILIEVKKWRKSRYVKENASWIADTTAVKPIPLEKGDTYLCTPSVRRFESAVANKVLQTVIKDGERRGVK